MKIIAFGVVTTPLKCNQRTRVRLIHFKLVCLAKYQFFSKLSDKKVSQQQYTHAAIWAIIATSILGFGDKAFEYFRMINPIEHARTKEACKKYKVEPYVIAADIYGASNLQGRGGWTWYTGSSSWLYKAGIEYLLGLKIKKGFLSIEPCIPKEWKEYEIKYKYKETIYNIKVKNPNQKMNTVDKFIVNGTEINEKQLKLENDGKIYEIEVIM